MYNIFRHTNYLELLKDLLSNSETTTPHKALAKDLGVHMSKLSKVLSGAQHITLDQAFLISQFFKFDSKETEFFMTLVQIARAANGKFKVHLLKKMRSFQVDRVPRHLNALERSLSQSEEAVLHSTPYFLAVWHLSMIEEQNSITNISEKLNISIGMVEQIATYLNNLSLVEMEGNKIIPKVRRIDIASSSKQIDKFLSNWRMVALEKLNSAEQGHFFYSEPMTLGKNAYARLRLRIEAAIAECKEIMATERSEVAVCLNVDLFNLVRSET